MDRIHRLFAKALQCSSEVKFIKLWEQAERFMSVWARAMNYCYRNGIEVPKEQEAERKALEKAIRACGMEETSEAFLPGILMKIMTVPLLRWTMEEVNGMPTRLRMKTPTEIRRTLARVANMALNGEIDSKTANTIILACNAVLGSIRTDEQQKKIDELEVILNDITKKP